MLQYLMESIPNYYLYLFYGKIRGFLQSWVLPTNQNCHEIIPGIYLGDISTAYNKDKLKELGVTNIINTVLGVVPAYPNDFEYFNVGLRDHTYEDIKTHFDKINRYMDCVLMDGGRIYIHCLCGISRSATIVSAYLMYKNNMSYEDAIEMVKSKRPIINPNDGFRKQLNDYDMERKTTNEKMNKSCVF